METRSRTLPICSSKGSKHRGASQSDSEADTTSNTAPSVSLTLATSPNTRCAREGRKQQPTNSAAAAPADRRLFGSASAPSTLPRRGPEVGRQQTHSRPASVRVGVDHLATPIDWTRSRLAKHRPAPVRVSVRPVDPAEAWTRSRPTTNTQPTGVCSGQRPPRRSCRGVDPKSAGKTQTGACSGQRPPRRSCRGVGPEVGRQ